MFDIRLQEGMNYSIQKKVSYEDTTVTFGRTGIETLFSTTALVGLMIEAAVELVGSNIPEGFITVVKKMDISHEKPTLQGMTVTITATLKEIKGNVLIFNMLCYDELGEIAKGVQVRHIVNKGALIQRAHERVRVLDSKN